MGATTSGILFLPRIALSLAMRSLSAAICSSVRILLTFYFGSPGEVGSILTTCALEFSIIF
jgi:hypothetical protein